MHPRPSAKRGRMWRRLAVLTLVLGAVMVACVVVLPMLTEPSCSTAPSVRLSGSFVQPTIRAADGQRWRADQAVEELGQVCIDEIVVQWSAYQTDTAATASYTPAGTELDSDLSGFVIGADFLKPVLRAAQANGKKVYLGLAADDRVDGASINWRGLWKASPAQQVEYLARQAVIEQAVARDLWKSYGDQFADTIAGWYMPLELSNITVLNQAVGAAGVARMIDSFYRPVVSYLHTLTGPGRRLDVITAPAFNTCTGRVDQCAATSQRPDDPGQPDGWYRTLRSLVSCARLDVVAVQDGVGAGHSSEQDAITWFRAAARAVRDGATQACDVPATAPPESTSDWRPRLRAIIETFAPGPGQADGFKPGPVVASDGPDDWTSRMNRIASDPVLRDSGVWSDQIWGFSYEHYDSPQAGHLTQHQRYCGYLGLHPPACAPRLTVRWG